MVAQRIAVSEQPTLSPHVQEAFIKFIEKYPARRLSRNLRNLLLEFLMYDGSNEAPYLQELVVDMQGLFQLLETLEENERHHQEE